MEYKTTIMERVIKMTNESTMSQSNSLGGKGIQIKEQNNYYGMSYRDTKELCLDLIQDELNLYKQEAEEEAKKRNEDLLNSFIQKLEKEKLDDATVGEEFKNPDMQYTYIDAQKAYIRLGTKELETILTDLLVCRIKERERSLLQIALGEAVTIVPMLLPKQLDALTLCFLLRYTKKTFINNLDSLLQYLNNEIFHFVTFSNEAKKESFFTHLAYTKAGNVEVTSVSLEKMLITAYTGLFCSGYENKQIENYKNKYPKLFLPYLHDATKWQINAIDEKVLNQECKKYPNMTDQENEEIIRLFNKNIMSESKVKDLLCKMNSNYAQLSELWNDTALKNLTLTTVGMVLGAMRFKMITGQNIDMTIWI